MTTQNLGAITQLYKCEILFICVNISGLHLIFLLNFFLNRFIFNNLDNENIYLIDVEEILFINPVNKIFIILDPFIVEILHNSITLGNLF